jgi:abortive infection bacteriophage resistance protein
MSEETKNTTVGTKLFTITPEGKEAIMQILSTKPFNTVLVMANLLEKPEFTDDEANQIINFIGAYPYGEVVTFFGRLKEYFVESSTEA